MEITKNFLNVTDVSQYMEISTSKAYKIIHSLNSELKKQGFLTVAGKVNAQYFLEKVYATGRAMN